MTVAGWSDQHLEKLVLSLRVIILGITQAIAAGLKASDSLLEGFFVCLANTHDLANRAHLGAKPIFYAFELLKRPAGELDYDIIPIRNIFVQGSILAAWNILKRKAGCQHGRYQGNRESGSLGSQCGRTGSSRVDLDDNDTVADRIVGELYVGAADNLYGLYNLVSLFLQTLLAFLGNSKHRSRTERISGMYAQGVDILDEAHGNHIVVGIADDLKFKLFPAQDGFFYQDLSHKAGLKASCAYRL